MDLLVTSPRYEEVVGRLMKYVKAKDKPLFAGEMANLLTLAIDHGIAMAEKKE